MGKSFSGKLALWQVIARVKASDRDLSLEKDEDSLKEVSLLDGCYVIKTDLSRQTADHP